MKWLAKTAALAALLLITVGAFAQGGGGQGRRFGMMMNNPVFLLRSPDVQTDLKLTDDQKAKLTKIYEEQRAARENAQASGQQPDRDTMRKMMEDSIAQINAILTPDQQARLKQIFIQTQKNRAITNPDVQDQLGLTSDQKDKIKDLNEKFTAAQMELFQRGREADDSTREQIRAERQKNEETLETELGKVLTPDQVQKLKELGGAPFTGKIERGGFGRRGGGK